MTDSPKYNDLHNLPLEDLSRIVQTFPWFAPARKELCIKLLESGKGDLAQEQIALACMHVCSRGKLRTDLEKARENVSVPKAKPAALPEKKKVVVVGGDFFSQDQYDSVESDEEVKVPSFKPVEKAAQTKEEKRASGTDALESFCTEPMAEILLDQGYMSEAKYIYSKLVLRYPEKSAYFAALIAKIDQEIKNI